MNISDISREISRAVEGKYGVAPEVEFVLDTPPDIELGDFSMNCFVLSKQFKKSPTIIAQEVATCIGGASFVAKSEAVGPYVNFRLSNEALFEAACQVDVNPLASTGRRVMVEYLSPNTNKPLHLGHTRNGVLGMAVSNMLSWAGHTVIRANLINDRGVHICKSMLAWQRFADGSTPQSTGKKGDHFVGDYYVEFTRAAKENPELENDARELLRKWECGDEETRVLWKRMNEWVYSGFAKTYERLGFSFDISYFESDLYMSGKDIVQLGLKKGIFEKTEGGAIAYTLPKDMFGMDKAGTPKKKVLLREDGTSVYITQDLGVALKKVNDFKIDDSFYVVACEQDDHFKALFCILQELGYPWAKQCRHLSYGMVELPSGRMKSREGTVVDADDLMDDIVRLVSADIRKRNPEIPEDEVLRRAEIIGIGAIKFYLVKSNPKQKIKFDPEESVALDGVTGLYCQYAYARIQSLIDKAHRQNLNEIEYSLLGLCIEERVLAQNLLLFKGRMIRSATEYNPALVANATYELAKSFNQWYNECPVLNIGDEKLSHARLALADATARVLKDSLGLLGIDVLDRI